MRFANLNSDFRKPENTLVLRWMLGLHDEKRPRAPGTGVPVPFVQNDGKVLQAGASDTLTWIGHASFLIQLGGKNILIDPVLSDRIGWVRRNAPPGLIWSTLPRVDVVLITHNHRDHMDGPTLTRLGKSPLYIVPKGLGQWFLKRGFSRVIELGWWEQEEIGGVVITFVPAEHWSRRGLTDINTSWWGGFVVRKDSFTLYHSGDTGWFEGFEEIGSRFGGIDVAMLPICAYAPRWFMNRQHIDPAEAVEAMKALRAKHFVAMHWGAFKLSDEPMDEPPAVLKDVWDRASLQQERLRIPAVGQTYMLDLFA